MKRICVYTCITGNYDDLHEIEMPEKNIDYYCFTNNKNLKSRTWKIIQIEDKNLDNIRLARKIKILGHKKINRHYEIAVWTDANVIWQKPISQFVDQYLQENPFAIFKHHSRNTIYDEAMACLKFHKDTKTIILKTLNFYHSKNFPDDNGLCESTVFIKKPHDAKVMDMEKIWFNMIKNYSRRDQLSFNYAAWKSNLKFDYINLNVWDNPWFNTNQHIFIHNTIECPVYYGNSELDFNPRKYYTYEYYRKNNIYSFNATIPIDSNIIEFYPTDNIGTEYKNLIIKPKCNRIGTHGIITYKKIDATCINHSIIYAYGDFKKGQKLSFSIEMKSIGQSGIKKLLEEQYFYNNRLFCQNYQLKQENAHLRMILQANPQKMKSKIIKKLKNVLKINN